MIDSPVFLVGAERSGTTLLRLMLSHHPRIAFANEFEIVVDPITSNGDFPSRAAFVDHLRKDRGFGLKKLDITPDLEFAALADDLLDQYRRRKPGGADVIGATVHRDFDRLLHIWPDARFIHLVRDGRDVALSTIPMGWHGNLYSGIGLWIEAEALWAKLAARLPADRHMTLHYEALVDDSEGELTRICRFVGLDYDPAMLRYDESSTYSEVNRSSIGKWRKQDATEVADAESIARPWLERNGYTLSRPPLAVSAARKLRYHLHDRWARMRFKQKRFSTSLWLADAVARRFGSAGWRASVRGRMHAITNQHIQ